MSDFLKTSQFLFCVVGIYVCFLTWAVLQERLTSVSYKTPSEAPKKFKYFVFLNMIQSVTASVIAAIYLLLRGQKLHHVSWSLLLEYSKVAFSSTIASPFGYASLKHINYPTMILGKSCKLLPVMLMNIVLHRKKFSMYQYFSVMLITAGVSGFMLLDKEKKDDERANSIYGLTLLLANLMIDGFTNSFQDKIFSEFKIKSTEMMFFMNGISALFMLAYLISPITGELSSAIGFISAFPQVIYDIVLFCICGAVGQTFIFFTLEKYGSLSLTMVTVTRKLFTILISLFWYGHEMQLGQWFFVSLVFLGIIVESLYKKIATFKSVKSSKTE